MRNSAVRRKSYLLTMRIPDSDLALIERAASLREQSRTDFVREAAVRAANDVLMKAGLVRMTQQGFAEFMAVLSAPAAPHLRHGRSLEPPSPVGQVARPGMNETHRNR